MSIESEIFKKSQFNFTKLKDYGFHKKENHYIYETLFNENKFRARITISLDGEISGNVFDTENNEEYLPLRIKYNKNAYSNIIKSAYIRVLIDIKENCTISKSFISNQANLITELIYQKWGIRPDFPWAGNKKNEDTGVFRNPDTNKWFGIIMNIDTKKLGNQVTQKADILNIKLKPEIITELVNDSGFYTAYHMNKSNWITIILDDTLNNQYILELIEESLKLTFNKKAQKKNLD